jgi:hypothetical protein
LYDTVVCPTPTPTATPIVPTPTPTPTPAFETQLWAYTNNTASLCNELNDDLVRGTYGAPAVGKIIYLEDGTTPVTGQVGPYFREQANGNVWEIAQNSGTIIAFVQTVVCVTPTPTATSVGPTPTPTPSATAPSAWTSWAAVPCGGSTIFYFKYEGIPPTNFFFYDQCYEIVQEEQYFETDPLMSTFYNSCAECNAG